MKASFWRRELLKGRSEVHWSDGETTVRIHSESKRASEIVQALRDITGGGPAEPVYKTPKFGKARPAKPHPDQTAMEI